jgi:cytochrome P450
MVSEGDEWRRQRRMIQPAFHKKVIARMMDHMIQLNEIMLDEWKLKAEASEPINITKETSKLTLDVVLSSLFSEDLQSIIDENGQNPFYLVHDNHNRDLQFAMTFRKLIGYVKQIKADREISGRMPFDFLSMLMETTDKETGEKMSEKMLMDEILTLIIAGHETTAASLNWAWFLLSKNPEIQDKLFAETSQMDGKNLSFEAIPQLQYTDAIIKEALRLYPPGWLLTRRAINDDRIGSYHVPARTDIFIPLYLIHRDEAYWQEPDVFRPERFLEPDNRHKFTYFPFAGGPRQCIGDQFATVEMILNLTCLSQVIRLEPATNEPVSLIPQINLRTRHDLFVQPVLR